MRSVASRYQCSGKDMRKFQRDSISEQMLMKECKRPLARPQRAGCAVAGAPLAVERMPRRITEYLYLGMRFRNLVHITRRNMLVLFSEVQHHRRLWPLTQVAR